MAMGNFCYAQGIECPYATAYGQCLDDIYEDFGICEMLGDDMPSKELPTIEFLLVLKCNSTPIHIKDSRGERIYSADGFCEAIDMVIWQ